MVVRTIYQYMHSYPHLRNWDLLYLLQTKECSIQWTSLQKQHQNEQCMKGTISPYFYDGEPQIPHFSPSTRALAKTLDARNPPSSHRHQVLRLEKTISMFSKKKLSPHTSLAFSFWYHICFCIICKSCLNNFHVVNMKHTLEVTIDISNLPTVIEQQQTFRKPTRSASY